MSGSIKASQARQMGSRYVLLENLQRTAEDSREWWTPDEEAKAMAILLGPWREKDPQASATLTTQILLGMRFSEVRALEKKDLDLQVPAVWIRRSQARKIVSTPKNKRARFHVIPPGTRR
jgi:integrase